MGNGWGKMEKNKITVIIPTLNSGKDIEECLISLQNQTYKHFKILIIDGHSRDKTVEICRRYGIEIKYDDGKNRAHACNTALTHVDMPCVVFTDADCITTSNWLEEVMNDLKRKDIAGVGGPNYSPEDDSNFAKAVDIVYSSKIVTGSARYGRIYKGTVPVNHNPGCNAAYKTEILKKAGFDDALPTAEDVVADYMICKNGGKLYFNPKAIVFHRRRPNLKGFWKQLYRYGLGRSIANKKYAGLSTLFHIIPTLALMVFPILTIGAIALSYLFSFIFFYLWIALVVTYFSVCCLGAIFSYSPHKNLKRILMATTLIPIAHVAWGMGYFKGMMS